MNYLFILPVKFYRVSADSIAAESAFTEHLKLLRDSLPEIRKITIAAPSMSRKEYEKGQNYLAVLNEPDERIKYVQLDPAGSRRVEYLLRYFISNLAIIWREVGNADVVHASASQFFYPREFLGIAFSWLRRKKSVFVVDIDWRKSAWMHYQIKQWSRKSYLLNKFIYNPAKSLQVCLAARYCSLVLLKSEKLVRDYGAGRKNVKNFLDASHTKEHVINEQNLTKKIQRLDQKKGTLNLVYFGRLTRYKGVDRMISVIEEIKKLNGPRVTLTIIGLGEEEPALKDQVTRAGLGELVTFVGPIPFGPALFAELQRHDLLMATPLAQDTPRSALDAMASGLPIVAYGIDYYVDLAQSSGAVMTVPWRDDKALVNAILKLHGQRQILIDMSSRAVDFARNNTQEIWLDRRARWTRSFCMQ